jgi:hypothetical protein
MSPFLESVKRTSTKKTGPKILIKFLRPGKLTLMFPEDGEFLTKSATRSLRKRCAKVEMNAAVILLLHGVDKCLTFTCNFTFTNVS